MKKQKWINYILSRPVFLYVDKFNYVPDKKQRKSCLVFDNLFPCKIRSNKNLNQNLKVHIYKLAKKLNVFKRKKLY